MLLLHRWNSCKRFQIVRTGSSVAQQKTTNQASSHHPSLETQSIPMSCLNWDHQTCRGWSHWLNIRLRNSHETTSPIIGWELGHFLCNASKLLWQITFFHLQTVRPILRRFLRQSISSVKWQMYRLHDFATKRDPKCMQNWPLQDSQKGAVLTETNRAF